MAGARAQKARSWVSVSARVCYSLGNTLNTQMPSNCACLGANTATGGDTIRLTTTLALSEAVASTPLACALGTMLAALFWTLTCWPWRGLSQTRRPR